MNDFITVATGQNEATSFNYWCWREIS